LHFKLIRNKLILAHGTWLKNEGNATFRELILKVNNLKILKTKSWSKDNMKNTLKN
jgi:hypothetical protein